MDRELLKKIEQGLPLDASEQMLLDSHLDLGSSDGPAVWVRSLHDSEPSLAWRSGLNSRLAELAPAKRTRRPVFAWVGMAVAGAACVWAVMTFTVKPVKVDNTPDQIVSSDGTPDDLASVMVSTHQAEEVAISMGVSVPRRTIETSFDWNSMENRRSSRRR